MRAPSICPMCKEKKKWNKIDQRRLLNGTEAVAGAALGSSLGMGAIVGGLIGSALGKGKKAELYCCGNCGFRYEYNG